MQQLSRTGLLQALSNTIKFAGDLEQALADEDIPYLRENLLIESVKSAFGESRGGRKRKPSDEAWAWIISDDQELPFSFNQCCLACGVDPDTMLDWLHYYKRKCMR